MSHHPPLMASYSPQHDAHFRDVVITSTGVVYQALSPPEDWHKHTMGKFGWYTTCDMTPVPYTWIAADSISVAVRGGKVIYERAAF